MTIRGAAARESILREKCNLDVVCLSHLRWNFVFQRPQHLLTRCAARRRVFFVEEPVFAEITPQLAVEQAYPGVWVTVPHMPQGQSAVESEEIQRGLLAKLFATHEIKEYILWFYTPMALGFTKHLDPRAIVYDCMDELSAFAQAPAALQEREKELFRRAHVVVTGGHSLYEAKRKFHDNIHPLPSSVDVAHFARGRRTAHTSEPAEPADQSNIPHPRLGFFGVIDERLNLDLISAIAEARPDWHVVMIGPVVKIDPATLPRRPNIHWLGAKQYDELPEYLAGWDIALLPFAHNDSTRFISPTKTPEYLAAGKPVVSTSIRDVVRAYGELDLIRIADTAQEFIAAIEAYLSEEPHTRDNRMTRIDAVLARMSWDSTYERIEDLLGAYLSPKSPQSPQSPK